MVTLERRNSEELSPLREEGKLAAFFRCAYIELSSDQIVFSEHGWSIAMGKSQAPPTEFLGGTWPTTWRQQATMSQRWFPFVLLS